MSDSLSLPSNAITTTSTTIEIQDGVTDEDRVDTTAKTNNKNSQTNSHRQRKLIKIDIFMSYL